MASSGFARHGVIRPQPRPLALHLRDEVLKAEHDLIHGIVERALAIFEIEKDAHTRIEDAFENVGRLDLFAPKPRFLAHDEPLKWRTRRQQA